MVLKMIGVYHDFVRIPDEYECVETSCSLRIGGPRVGLAIGIQIVIVQHIGWWEGRGEY